MPPSPLSAREVASGSNVETHSRCRAGKDAERRVVAAWPKRPCCRLSLQRIETQVYMRVSKPREYVSRGGFSLWNSPEWKAPRRPSGSPCAPPTGASLRPAACWRSPAWAASSRCATASASAVPAACASLCRWCAILCSSTPRCRPSAG